MRSCWPRLLLLAGLACALPACSALNKAASQSSISFLHTYEVALKRFESGHIMEARDHILRMDKTRDDYPKALRLLRTKIEPARRRLLAHYSRRGAKAEKRHEWAKALAMYEQAASFAPGDKRLAAKVQRMDLHLRQLRMDTLIVKRRAEDMAFLSWLNAYIPPKGLDARDVVFAREREKRQEWVEDRAAEAYREANRYLMKGYPEVAYAEIESHLRLDPDSRKGRKLRKQIVSTLPKGLKLPHKAKFKRQRLRVPGDISAVQIRQLMRQGKLLRARTYAIHYKRRGGKDADALLKSVRTQISKAAAAAFEKGRKAFREERLADAVRNWRRAVALMPDESIYVESLRRAEQLRERLRILRGGK